ncbi:MAG: hypothetical protein V4635_14170 [Bacteroidota bacterium]
MKKVALSFSILALTALFTIVGCKKEKNVAPEPDTELQSSVDVTYGFFTLTDIEQWAAFLGENQLFPKFYMPAAHSTGTIVPNRDTVNKEIKEAFNNTTCVDGRLRNGSIFMNYNNSAANSKYYHDYQFKAKVILVNYKVDGWSVIPRNGSQITIENLVSPVNYSTSTTNLSWRIVGDVDLFHPTDSSKDIHMVFDLVKTLLNTSTSTVFPASKQAAINWSLAVVGYKGTIYGETSGNVPFKYNIDADHEIVRNFTCTPDKLYGVNVPPAGTGTTTARFEEYHPFVNGSAAFTTAALYPRVIHYGPEVPVPNNQAPCDNSGTVTIKGISYPVDFKK